MDTQISQNEDLKRRLKEATDIIKSRDETIAARDAQIAGLQSELDDLRKQLPDAKAAELEADLNKTKGDPERPCLELQDALSKQLPQEIHHKMLPASRTIALRQTDSHGRIKGKCGCAGEARSSVPRRPRASGQVERLERVV